MPPKRYTAQELEQILSEFESGTSLTDLGEKLNRSPYGVALKMIALSEQDPSTWDPMSVNQYTRQEITAHKGDVKGQNKRWRARHGSKPRGAHAIWLAGVKDDIDWGWFRTYLTGVLSAYFGTKQAFACELHTHPSELSRYLSGERNPSYRFFREMAEFIHIPYESFEARFLRSPENRNHSDS